MMGWIISLILLVIGLESSDAQILLCSAIFACAGAMSSTRGD